MSHHIHCNDEALDEDVFSAFPALRFDSRLPMKPWHRWQHIYMVRTPAGFLRSDQHRHLAYIGTGTQSFNHPPQHTCVSTHMPQDGYRLTPALAAQQHLVQYCLMIPGVMSSPQSTMCTSIVMLMSTKHEPPILMSLSSAECPAGRACSG